MIDLLQGIDLSVYQRAHRDGTALPFDPKAIAAAGYTFAIARLGHGVTVDPWGVLSVRQLQDAGLKCSVYWFLESSPTADQQEEAFATALFESRLNLDFLPALDIETGGPETADKALSVLKGLEIAWGAKPIVYTSPSFAATRLNRPEFVDYPLWVAAYTNGPAPMRCPPWFADAWAIWQWSGTGQVDGIATPCDLNRARTLPGLL